MTLKRPVTIARNGRILGEFSSSDLAPLLDAGQLGEADECYIEHSNSWLPVRDYIKSAALPRMTTARESEDDDSPERMLRLLRLWESSAPVIIAWTAFTIAFAALVGAAFWINNLQNQSNALVVELNKTREQLREALSNASSAPATPGPAASTDPLLVTGQVKLPNEQGEATPVPAFTIYLYRRAAMEEYLESKKDDLMEISRLSDDKLLARFLNDFPTPLLQTTTDSDGRFEFSLPSDGDYVVYSSISVPTPSGVEVLVWLLSLDTTSTAPILVEDSNRTRSQNPSLMILPGR